MIRKARVPDVVEIHKLINSFAEADAMLPRSLNAIYENVRDFFVLDDDGHITGCCALHIAWENLAEIKSLAVAADEQSQGLGKKLVEQCLAEARELGIPRVFALTYVTGFFEKLGFQKIDKATLPHKIWSECINCPKFPDCGEEAVVIELRVEN